MESLQNHYLVGGTALALQFGHRISVDIDLFCNQQFDSENIINALQNEFGNAFQYEGGLSKFGIFCFIDSVKVDIVRYPHPMVFNAVEEGGIRMYHSSEIAAMKVQAIFGRAKKKDFWDVAELFKIYAVEELISFHHEKYPSQQMLISIPSALTYFAEADDSEDPVSLKGQTWAGVKAFIQQKVNQYLK